jgi:putative ABC transport system permease protein
MKRTFGMIGIGLSGLSGNPFRTALTVLGIVIGVSAVILLTALGNGVQDRISGQIGDLGTNLVQVSPGVGEADGGPFGAAAASTLTPEDAKTVAGLPSVAAASPSVSIAAPVEAGAGMQSVSLTGVDPSYDGIASVELESGRFVEGRGEMVLSAPAAEDLLGLAPEDLGGAVGKRLAVKGKEYEVVGVAQAAAEGEFGPPMPESTYVTTADALAISGTETVGQITVQAENAGSVGAAAREIEGALKEAHGGAEDFSVTTQEELLSTFTQISDLMTYLLAGIAGISLLVGGIGVMNIMLVSVAERTREIGLRKALGATDRDVLSQFLSEAVFLALIGGLLGVALGVGVATVLPIISSNLPTAVTWASVGLAFGVSALIGVVFGVLPAYRSARLAPVEALRRE